MDFKTLYNDPKFSGSFTGQERFISALKDAGTSSRGARRALQKIDSDTYKNLQSCGLGSKICSYQIQ